MSFWTDERITELKVRWARGDSAGTIWRAMKAQSRSAVIGKVHRLKLASRNTKARSNRPVQPRAIRTKRFIFSANGNSVTLEATPIPEPEINELEIPIEQRCSIGQLTDATCHWIIGDTQDPTHFYCGAITIGDRPWCAYHAKKATDGHATSASSRKQLTRLALWRN